MSSNALFFGWNRPVIGRERMSAEHFGGFVQYLNGLQQKGTISAYDIVFLNPHGGDMNGFFLIRGEPGQLNALTASAEWVGHVTRAMVHLDHAGVVPAVTGDMIQARMDLWLQNLPA